MSEEATRVTDRHFRYLAERTVQDDEFLTAALVRLDDSPRAGQVHRPGPASTPTTCAVGAQEEKRARKRIPAETRERGDLPPTVGKRLKVDIPVPDPIVAESQAK